MASNLKNIFFDLDHTLWDFERNSTLAFSEIFLKNGIDVDLETFLKSYLPINNFYWEKYRNDLVTKEKLRYGRLEGTFQEMNFKISRAQIELLTEDYILYLSKNNHLFEDAHTVLETLQQKYNLHVITNGFSEVQMLKLKNSKINHYFKTITTSEEAGVKKPHGKIFQLALYKANANAMESLMVGDNLEADILGAEAYGIKAIWYNLNQNKEAFQGKSINQLTQLLDIL
jgi:putative hydrolase of the HAD superfamily